MAATTVRSVAWEQRISGSSEDELPEHAHQAPPEQPASMVGSDPAGRESGWNCPHWLGKVEIHFL